MAKSTRASLVVILGMHRSGTSCLARMLRRAGVYFGDNLLDDTASDNLQGHSEAKEAVAINDQILALSGGSWEEVPEKVQGDVDVDARIEIFLDSLRARPIAGWKDPRTIVTFPVWKPHLENYRIVATFRHPMNVAHSLQACASFSNQRMTLGTAGIASIPENIDISNQWCLASLVPLVFDNVTEEPRPYKGIEEDISVWQGIPFHTVVISGTTGWPRSTVRWWTRPPNTGR